MKKNIISVFIIELLTLLMINTYNNVQAVSIHTITGNPEGYVQAQNSGSGELVNMGNVIVGIVRAIGTSISVLLLMIMGLKYIVGSAQEKAEYKQTMWPFIVGAILIFGASQVVQIIYDIIK